MKISWPKGMERWKAVLDRYRYALLVIAAGVLLLLLPLALLLVLRPCWRRSWPAPCPASMERGRRRSC